MLFLIKKQTRYTAPKLEMQGFFRVKFKLHQLLASSEKENVVLGKESRESKNQTLCTVPTLKKIRLQKTSGIIV
jgi:hypothetical protein